MEDLSRKRAWKSEEKIGNGDVNKDFMKGIHPGMYPPPSFSQIRFSSLAHCLK